MSTNTAEQCPAERIAADIREFERAKATVVPVDALMDTPDGRDEHGTPDDAVCECSKCGTLYRRDGAHRCLEGWTDE